eukprot:TRINITY_DN12571_c0_g1_i2.p1 TRINITY_DN12571_c0_g1~~TRINITY_DN12571_c0_g1_i2.p1  ORF type:complete len:163 (-),score=32.80 TRINITY_DN12571_c0_g1_i2:185-673(-)
MCIRDSYTICTDEFFKEVFYIITMFRKMMSELKNRKENGNVNNKKSDSLTLENGAASKLNEEGKMVDEVTPEAKLLVDPLTDAGKIPYYSNEFVDYMHAALKEKHKTSKFEYFGVDAYAKEFLVEFTFHFCRWLYVQRFTSFLLTKKEDEAQQPQFISLKRA